jgi:hypothetical protein
VLGWQFYFYREEREGYEERQKLFKEAPNISVYCALRPAYLSALRTYKIWLQKLSTITKNYHLYYLQNIQNLVYIIET